MVTVGQLVKEFTWIDLEPWIAEIENRIANIKYPSKSDVSLLPKLKEALKIQNDRDHVEFNNDVTLDDYFY